jgi:transcriptional regulator with XRE-family HTH domain
MGCALEIGDQIGTRGTLRVMVKEEEAREVWIAREVLRRMLRGKSLAQLSLAVGKARNYLARLLKGDILFTVSAAVDALHAAGLAPADYFRLVGEECAGAQEDDAVRELMESFGTPPGLRRIEDRVDEINERLIRLASKLAQE